MIRYVHGSADSTDLDVVYVFENVPSFVECQAFCRSDPKENRNIIVVKDGIVDYCFKGNKDEVNNALLATYSLHEQAYPLLISHPVPRDVFLKDISVTRKVISPLTDTPMRKRIKETLRASWDQRLTAMQKLKFAEIDFDHVGKWKKDDLLKSMAFQLGQAISLHQGVELYTKADIASFIPQLHPYLYRQAEGTEDLQTAFDTYLQILFQTEIQTLQDNCVQLPSGAVYDIHKEKRMINRCTIR